MENNDFKYISTKLNKLSFDADKFTKQLSFTLKITNKLKVNSDNNSSVIKLLAILKAENVNEEIATHIEMMSVFKVDYAIDEERLGEFIETNREELHKPLLDEMTLIFGIISGKGFKAPLVIPFSSFIEESNEVEETE